MTAPATGSTLRPGLWKDYYAPEYERTLAWNDPELKIDWDLKEEPILSPKDQRGVLLRDAECFD